MSDTYDSDAQRMTREQLEYAYARAMRANAMALQASEVFYRVERRDSQIIGNLKRDLLAEKARADGLARECQAWRADERYTDSYYRSHELDGAIKATDAAGWLEEAP